MILDEVINIKKSCARDVSYWHHDDKDEIRFQNEDGSWEVE